MAFHSTSSTEYVQSLMGDFSTIIDHEPSPSFFHDTLPLLFTMIRSGQVSDLAVWFSVLKVFSSSCQTKENKKWVLWFWCKEKHFLQVRSLCLMLVSASVPTNLFSSLIYWKVTCTKFRPVPIFVLLTWNWFIRTNFRTFEGLKTKLRCNWKASKQKKNSYGITVNLVLSSKERQ